MGAVGQAAVAIARDLGVEVIGRASQKSLPHAKSIGLSVALDYAQPLPRAFDGTFDLVFDVHGSLSASEGDRLVKRGGVVVDIAPTKTKFLRALVSRSRKVVFADVSSKNLEQVIRLAADRKLVIPIARTIALSEAPAVMAELERGNRLNGKVIISFPE
jgi:NADPH:quinone reductase-like Zn-dependent oxidoreductase